MLHGTVSALSTGAAQSTAALLGHVRCVREVAVTGARCAGTKAGLAFSLNYAAPEVLEAQEAGARTIVAAPAADIWALGVVAYEILSRDRAFPLTCSSASIRAQIMGREELPWERPGRADVLRTAKHSVLQCLARVPSARPTAPQLAATWRNLLEFAAVKHTVVTAV